MKLTTLGLLAILLFCAASPSSAQSPFGQSRFTSSNSFASKKDKDKNKDGDNNDNNNGSGSNPTNVPFDGGLAALLVAGAAYGAKRYRSQRGNSGEAA